MTHDCSYHGTYSLAEKTCTCDPGWTGPSCAETDCSCGGHGDCVVDARTGVKVCVCDAGYSGAGCEQDLPVPWRQGLRRSRPLCLRSLSLPPGPRGCRLRAHAVREADCSHHGKCVPSGKGLALGTCKCDPGWGGKTCSVRQCAGLGQWTLTLCSGHGACLQNSTCACMAGWRELACAERSCPDGCHGRGVCKDGVCFCANGFDGPSCQRALCPTGTDHPLQAGVVGAVCSHRGVCGADGTCRCHKGASGTDCSRVACSEPDCSHRGVCVPAEGANGLIGPSLPPPVCKCNATYYGDGCEYKRCDHECGEAEGRGQCAKRSGTCACKLGWKGEACEVRACEGGCGEAEGRGACKPVAGSASLELRLHRRVVRGAVRAEALPEAAAASGHYAAGPADVGTQLWQDAAPRAGTQPRIQSGVQRAWRLPAGCVHLRARLRRWRMRAAACPNDCSHRARACARVSCLPQEVPACSAWVASSKAAADAVRSWRRAVRVRRLVHGCRLHRTRVPQQLLGRWPLLHLARLQVRLPGGIQRSRLQRQVVRLALPRAARPLHPRQVPLRGRVERRRVRPAELPCGLLRPRPVHLWRLRARLAGMATTARTGVRRKGRARGRWRRRLRRERKVAGAVSMASATARPASSVLTAEGRAATTAAEAAASHRCALDVAAAQTAAPTRRPRACLSCFPRLQALNLQAQGRLSWPAVGRDFLWYPAEVVRARVRRERVRGADVLDGLQRPWALPKDGTCVCALGYAGPDCAETTAPNSRDCGTGCVHLCATQCALANANGGPGPSSSGGTGGGTAAAYAALALGQVNGEAAGVGCFAQCRKRCVGACASFSGQRALWASGRRRSPSADLSAKAQATRALGLSAPSAATLGAPPVDEGYVSNTLPHPVEGRLEALTSPFKSARCAWRGEMSGTRPEKSVRTLPNRAACDLGPCLRRSERRGGRRGRAFASHCALVVVEILAAGRRAYSIIARARSKRRSYETNEDISFKDRLASSLHQHLYEPADQLTRNVLSCR